MEITMKTVLEIRSLLTDIIDKIQEYFSTDEVIDSLMTLRGYNISPYAENIQKTLKEVGVFKIDFLSELQMICKDIKLEDLVKVGLVDNKGNYFLSGRYAIPIRDISGKVSAVVGWLPQGNNNTKYLTTPTLGFSKAGQFFNMECFEMSFDGVYPKYRDEETGEVLESKGLVYLVEGIFDALSLRALGLPALSNMGLELSMVKTEILTRFSKVIAIPDNDSAGRATNPYLYKISGKKQTMNWSFKNNSVIVQLPKGVKDVDEFICKYYCLDDLLKCQKATYKITLSED